MTVAADVGSFIVERFQCAQWKNTDLREALRGVVGNLLMFCQSLSVNVEEDRQAPIFMNDHLAVSDFGVITQN